ncbi:MAG: hypothetical protein ACKPKO_41260, partial [Candidatus Fonsibacter sp.]
LCEHLGDLPYVGLRLALSKITPQFRLGLCPPDPSSWLSLSMFRYLTQVLCMHNSFTVQAGLFAGLDLLHAHRETLDIGFPKPVMKGGFITCLCLH